jgi:prophage DNA circulation protein
VCAGIDLFNTEFGKLGKGEEKTRECISTTVFKIHDAIRDTDARAYLLAARIGQDNTMASGEGAESVWDTLRRVVSMLDEVQELVEAGSQETLMLTETIRDSQDKMGNMSQNLIGLKQYVVDSVATIHRKVSNLESSKTEIGNNSPGLARLQGRLDDLEEKARDYAKTSKKNDGMERLEVDVAVLQRRMDQRDHGGKYDLNHVDRTTSALGNASGESNAGLQDQIDSLTLRDMALTNLLRWISLHLDRLLNLHRWFWTRRRSPQECFGIYSAL